LFSVNYGLILFGVHVLYKFHDGFAPKRFRMHGPEYLRDAVLARPAPLWRSASAPPPR